MKPGRAGNGVVIKMDLNRAALKTDARWRAAGYRPSPILAALIVLFGLTLCDNVFPRVRWERMLAFTWGTTLVAGGGNMLILMLLDK